MKSSFRRWGSGWIPALEAGTGVAVDGKTGRCSRSIECGPRYLVSALASGIAVVLGQEAAAEKSNEITAIPLLLQTLAIKGAMVTMHAVRTHAPIAQVVQDKQADYVLAMKDNQPHLAESIRAGFATAGRAGEALGNVRHDYYVTVEKNHGRIEVRRYYAFRHPECLSHPAQWLGLRRFGVVQSGRTRKDKTCTEVRLCIGGIAPEARELAHALRSHWAVANRLHWCLDVCLNDDQARAKNSAAHLAAVRRTVLKFFRPDKSRKGGIKARHLVLP